MFKRKMIKCKNCFWKWRSDKKDYCKVIETEGGGSIEANQTECTWYVKKGTEPKWLCSVCGKNTYGESSVSEKGKHYCDNCHWKIENKKWLKEEHIKEQENIKKVSDILGGNKKLATKIIKSLRC